MKKFIYYIFIFSFLCAILLLTLNFFIDRSVNNKEHFKIQPNKQFLILGHSHPACAYNDSLMPGFQNLSSTMEGYFYTYYKLKKLISSNNTIKGVFLEYTNNQIHSFGNERIFGQFLPNQLPKYTSVIDMHGILFLLSKSPIKTIQSLNISLWKKASFVIHNKKDFLKEGDWGGYLKIEHINDNDDSLAEDSSSPNAIIKYDYSVSSVNLWYLGKIVKLCKDNNIKIYLIRTPTSYLKLRSHNESLFMDILRNEFPDIPFLDFNNLTLSKSDYADNAHLNYYGSKKISVLFYALVRSGLLEKENKQEFINEYIQKTE